MENLNHKEREFLLRIARHLLMNVSFMHDISLYHGKMGVVLFFVHYAQHSDNPLYHEFAIELLFEVCEEIHEGLPVDFESGLCGIGWGIEYLLQHGFIEGDSDEILSELDDRLMEFDLRRIGDRSLCSGLEGISCYIDKRINSSSRKSGILPFDETYLTDWKSVASTGSIPEDTKVLDTIIGAIPEGEDITFWKLGLNNGCAGAGLKRIRQ